jgi:hypothetical protein
MSKTSVTMGGGLTLLEVLFVVFLVLKLTGKTVVATWSWWWVTAPLWIGFAIIFAIFFISFLIIGLSWLIKRKR